MKGNLFLTKEKPIQKKLYLPCREYTELYKEHVSNYSQIRTLIK